jgi:hypothetical protein
MSTYTTDEELADEPPPGEPTQQAAYTSPATVIVPGKWTLKIGPTTASIDFTCDAGGVHLTSEPQTTTVGASWCQNGYDDVGSVKHNLVIDFQAFIDEAASLWYWLWSNAGIIASFEISGSNRAVAPTTPFKIAGKCRVVPGPFDGIAGDVVTGTVTMPCTTVPVVTVVAP